MTVFTSVEPYMIQVRCTDPARGWIDWMTVETDNRNSALSHLLAQGCGWAKPGKPYSREWRVVPNPDLPRAVLTVKPDGRVT